RTQLPRGPKGKWIVGNLDSIVSTYQWKQFSEWSKVFGDILYLKVLGQHIIVLHDLTHAQELMDKNGAIYSDRPKMTYVNKLVKIQSLTFMPYGSLWRTHRKLMHHYLNTRGVDELQPAMLQSVRTLLEDLLIAPDEF
ncbi:cytochrome P450, partial [Fomitiporia mediterranea MF3/22]|uniref:cytochrome P450 n=1 Tax=Fomitiporia mediterranea (strain MF3/22) TaxID=694068 RepID=UPI0004407C13